jgi:hypothetical protein
MTTDHERYMGQRDALAYNIEHDPGLRSTIMAVTWLDGTPDLGRLASRLERATHVATRFRQRPVTVPGKLAPPRWVDADLDLSFHLRHLRAPAPATRDTVLEYVRTQALESFDPARPHWVFTLVDGLENGESAFVLKVHHAMTDGIGGMQLAQLLFDLTPEPGPGFDPPLPAPEPVPGATALVRDALVRAAGRTIGAATTGARRLVPPPAAPSGIRWGRRWTWRRRSAP